MRKPVSLILRLKSLHGNQLMKKALCRNAENTRRRKLTNMNQRKIREEMAAGEGRINLSGS